MIKIIAVGKIKDGNLTALIDDYRKRISRFSKIEIIEVADVGENQPLCKALDTEAAYVIRHVRPQDFVVLCAVAGQRLDSITYAKTMADWQSRYSDIVYVIGGSNGVGSTVAERADFSLSLSDLTFPHQLTRLVLLEQIYRGLMINNNRCYHK